MPTRTFSRFVGSGLLAAGLGAAVSAQDPQSLIIGANERPTPEHRDPAAGGGAAADDAALARAAALRRFWTAPQQQETDYSERHLFQTAHQDFMLKRERFDPNFEVSASGLPDDAVQNETGRFDLVNLRGDLEAPLVVAPDGYLVLGAFGDVRNYQTRNMPGFPDESLIAAGAKLGFGVFLGKDVLLEGMVEPGVWTDGDGTTHHKDFDFPASVLVTMRSTEDLFFKIGARYNEVYEEANLLPWLGLSWQSESVRVDLMLPEHLEVSFWPSASFGILGGLQIQGAEYHVRSSAATGHQRADVRVQEVLVYGGAIWRFNDYVSMQAKVGAAVAGDYKLDDGLSGTPRVNGTLDPALFLNVSFGFDW